MQDGDCRLCNRNRDMALSMLFTTTCRAHYPEFRAFVILKQVQDDDRAGVRARMTIRRVRPMVRTLCRRSFPATASFALKRAGRSVFSVGTLDRPHAQAKWSLFKGKAPAQNRALRVVHFRPELIGRRHRAQLSSLPLSSGQVRRRQGIRPWSALDGARRTRPLPR